MTIIIENLEARIVVQGTDRIKTELKGVSRESTKSATKLRQLDKSARKAGGGMKAGAIGVKAMAAAAAAAYIALRTVVKILKDVIAATSDYEQSQARLTAVLKATEMAAGRTADQIDRMAQQFAQTTLFSDEQVRDAAGMLATFKNIQELNFDRSIAAILDLSQVMGQDLKSSAVQIGKALNDPIAGIAALSRVGVAFTDVQKDMIIELTNENRLFEAQTIILEELEGEFGGGAAAADTGISGAIRGAKKAYDDFAEVLGRETVIGAGLETFFNAIEDVLRVITFVLRTDVEIDLIDEITKLQGELDRAQIQSDLRAEKGDQASVDRFALVIKSRQESIDANQEKLDQIMAEKVAANELAKEGAQNVRDKRAQEIQDGKDREAQAEAELEAMERRAERQKALQPSGELKGIGELPTQNDDLDNAVKRTEEENEILQEQIDKLAFLGDAWVEMFEAIGSGQPVFATLASAFKRSLADMATGEAKFQVAEAAKDFAIGAWPFNPAAIAAGFKHLGAAALFAAGAGFVGGTRESSSPGGGGPPVGRGVLTPEDQTTTTTIGESSAVTAAGNLPAVNPFAGVRFVTLGDPETREPVLLTLEAAGRR